VFAGGRTWAAGFPQPLAFPFERGDQPAFEFVFGLNRQEAHGCALTFRRAFASASGLTFGREMPLIAKFSSALHWPFPLRRFERLSGDTRDSEAARVPGF